jgi:Cu+-exporting ATPase
VIFPVTAYKEMLGKGIEGLVNGKKLYIGSKRGIDGIGTAGINDSGVHVVIDELYKGYFSVNQEWRDGMQPLIANLAKSNELFVISGDTDKDEAELRNIFGQRSSLSFNQSPREKLNAIKKLQASGKQVMMLGDGLNDAGALKQANFGVAITDNINNFTPGCDAILKGSSLDLLPKFIQLSKDGLKTVKISFGIATAYNLIGVYYAVQGTLYPLVAAVLMPISTATIISFTSLATRYFAKKNGLSNSSLKN